MRGSKLLLSCVIPQPLRGEMERRSGTGEGYAQGKQDEWKVWEAGDEER